MAKTLPTSQCALGDLACLCSDQTYITGSETCVASTCTIKEALRKFQLQLMDSHLLIPLTSYPVTQRWQKAACHAPVRNTGLLTSRVGIALVIIAGACVILRFLARWFVADSHVGWDDWTILVSLILLIPSTILLHTSSLLSSIRSLLPFLMLSQQWNKRAWAMISGLFNSKT